MATNKSGLIEMAGEATMPKPDARPMVRICPELVALVDAYRLQAQVDGRCYLSRTAAVDELLRAAIADAGEPERST